jgi:hypothetical protein
VLNWQTVPRSALRATLQGFPREGFLVIPYRVLSVSLLAMLIATGCGQSNKDLGFANRVTVSISPATASVAANNQVTLQATVNGLCSGCASDIFAWSISEDATSGGSNCNWFDTPPTVSCPAGTIQQTQGASGSTLTVTYHAPSTPGTYHVVAEWCDCVFTPVTKKTGTSVISVTP